jgi:leucyl aminopeptidase
MSLKLTQNTSIGNEKSLSLEKHILFVLNDDKIDAFPYAKLLTNKLKRSKAEFTDLKKSSVTLELPNGGLASYVMLTDKLTIYQKHTLLRKAIKPLLDEQPATIALCVYGDEATREANACAAYYVTTVNAVELPSRKKKDKKSTLLKSLTIYGFKASHNYGYVDARVAGNTLCRSLTMLPPNELTPAIYRKKVASLAKQYGWRV